MDFEPILTRHLDDPSYATLEGYLGRGGYAGAQRAYRDLSPEQVVEMVRQSGLRGRGGAGFPTGQKWGFVPQDDRPRYLVCNADESEPGTFKDRLLIEKAPHLLLEGILIAARALRVRRAFIYIRGEMGEGARSLDKALRELRDRGWLGDRVFESGTPLEITVHRGAGAYICGEETALLSSIEGARGYPRLKPPFPAVEGLFRSPTIVNNVETLCNLPCILVRGADWYRTIGTERSPGPKIFSISGHVRRPGNYELPMGVPFRVLLNERAGGVDDGRTLKAVIPGGSSVPVLTAQETADLRLDFESVSAAGSLLGSGGVIVMDDSTCMVDALLNLARFYHHESCGQCTPCREGCGWIEKILARVAGGEGRSGDLDLCLEVARNMVGRTICVLADALAMPVLSFIGKFRAEFEAHIRQKACPLQGVGRSP